MQKRKSFWRTDNGITLIALVVTIIILLILAGVTLKLINSDNGIIAQARWAEFVTEYEKLDEQKELYVAGKQMDKLSEEYSKADWRSLFSNISYALDVPETMYPVDLNQPFSTWDAVDTLQDTICYVENLQYSELFDKSKVDLYRVDLTLIPKIELRRDYIINIVTGMLYYIDGEPYKGLVYHTPRYGVPKKTEPDMPENPEPDEPDPDDPDNPPTPMPPVYPDEPGKSLNIHYLSYEAEGYAQEVAYEDTICATLDKNKFARDGYTFMYWLDNTSKYDGSTMTGDFRKTEGYFGVANNLVKVLDENWEEDILDIIESYEEYEEDGFEADDEEQDPDEAPEPTMEELRRNEILDYFSGYEMGIQNLFTNTTMNLKGLADWFVANQAYLAQLQEYENGLEDILYDDEEESSYNGTIYYDQQIGVAMNGKDMWLQAIWTLHPLTLDANGGTIENQPKITVELEPGLEYGDAIFDPDARENYVFAGWFTSPSGGTQIVEENIYQTAELPGKTLYAHWVKEKDDSGEPNPEIVPITYDANGGTLTNSGTTVTTITKNKVKGTKIGSMPEPYKDRRIFDGWWTEPNGGMQVTVSSTVTETMTLYAHWTEGNFVDLDLVDGELINTYRYAWQVQSYFHEWNPVRFSGIQVANGRKIGKQAKYWQLPVTWSQRKIRKVRYVTQPNGKQRAVKSRFKGWFTQPEGAGTKIKYYSKYYNSYGKNLYANWKDPYVITYDANGGKFGKTATQKQRYNKYIGQRYPRVSTPKQEGYRFLGWFDSPVGGNKIEMNNWSYTINGDATLYAQWEKVNFTLQITDKTDSSWNQSITPIDCDLSTCTIYYKYSKKQENANKHISSYTTKKNTVTNRKAGTTYYVWAMAKSKNNEKFYSNMVEVMLDYAPMEFTVNVSNIKNNGWTQGKSATLGSLTGYSVTYHISNSVPANNTANGNIANPTGTLVTGKSDATTYYVWATAKKGTHVVGSNNYVTVKTGHTHTGSATKGTGCYTGAHVTCDKSFPTIVKSITSWPAISCPTNSWCCVACGSMPGKGTTVYGTASKVNVVFRCLACGVEKQPTGTGYRFVCAQCYTKLGNYVDSDGQTWMNAMPIRTGSNGYFGLFGSQYSGGNVIPHANMYKLGCGKAEGNGTATSVNF